MLRTIFVIMFAVALGITPAHAAIFSFDFGTPGQTSGTVTYDTALGGTGFAPDSRRIGATFSNLFLQGVPIDAGSLRGNVSQAVGTTGSQTLVFNQLFASPFFPRPDFTTSFTLEFQSVDRALFSADGMVASPGILAAYFTSGLVNPQPGQVVHFGLAVPEPAAWALMIVGLCAIGVRLRRQQAQALTA